MKAFAQVKSFARIESACVFNYIGYTCRHLHQRVEEHKHSVIGKHFRDVHYLTPGNLIKNFKVIKKCRGKIKLFAIPIKQ